MQNDLGDQTGAGTGSSVDPGFVPDPYDRRRVRQVRRLARRAKCGGTTPRLIGAVLMIAAGVLLFLDNIGVLPIREVWQYWPVLLIALGVAKLSGSRLLSDILLSIFCVSFGGLFLLSNLGVVHIRSWNSSWPVSLFLIAFGLVALVKALETARRPQSSPFGFSPKVTSNGPQQSSSFPPRKFEEHNFGGNIRRKIDTDEFAGGEIHTVFGNVEIDLRNAQISPRDRQATVEIHAVFGGVKLLVPTTWRVSARGQGVFGNFEDKTLPPRASQGFEPPWLNIIGSAVFAPVEIDN
jgi:predicted membrane protein